MDAQERYYWDIAGHLVVRNVLTPEEIQAANEALDYAQQWVATGEEDGGAGHSTFLKGAGARWYKGDNLLNIEKPYCNIIRTMLAHPKVISRLKVMCGPGFRLDHGPQFNNATKGTVGLTLHGSGEPHRPYVAYHHQAGETHCGGVTVTWNLTDCPAGGGGFACVPGSHKSKFPMPDGVRYCDKDMGTVIQPEAKAGDVLFFMDGAQTHGTHPWTNDHERRSILFKFASRTATRGGQSAIVADPEIYWDKAIVDGMTDEQRAVMYGPYSGHGGRVPYLNVENDGTIQAEGKKPTAKAVEEAKVEGTLPIAKSA
ncbi:MAG: phytanoyl-CoA dioxygenase family protein [bacterium]|nr:phytanoyl-CoA dioxygenase family protein [bacterium]